jgi:DNA-binding HxlR family transcriptional regulator
MNHDKTKPSNCSLTNALNMLGSRWKPVIICAMRKRKVRFGQLVAVIGLSKKVLTEQLRQLEEDGIVLREEFHESSVRIEYSLTPKGQELVPILNQLEAWDRRHVYHAV